MSLSPDLVIHCAGPFQNQDYRVAEAAASMRANYIDLSDGRTFVTKFADAMGTAAHDAGVLMISGASSVPALSSAVIDALLPRFGRLEEIRMFIAPGQRAQRGAATLAGVFSYAGRPMKWLRGGVWQDAWGWQELVRIDLPDLGWRWAAACDIPDLDLLPVRYHGVRTVEFRAALEFGIQHFALWVTGSLRRSGVPLPIERMASKIDRVASLLNCFGGERGGMLVSLAGIGTNALKTRIDWHITADRNHGPEIPCMAAILLARKMAKGELAARGAFPCMDFLSLADFESEFARWYMRTGIRETPW